MGKPSEQNVEELPVVLAPPLAVTGTYDDNVAKRFKVELLEPLTKDSKAA